MSGCEHTHDPHGCIVPGCPNAPDEERWSDAAQRPRKRRARSRSRETEEQLIEETYAILGVR